MSYRLNTDTKPLFLIETAVERYEHSRLEYLIKAKSNFKKLGSANDVEVKIPVPSDVDGPKFKPSTGYCKYMPQNNCFIWRISSFPGRKEFICHAHFNLPSVKAEEVEVKAPIEVKFELPYFTLSRLEVRFLKIIEKSGYSAMPWIRYITRNGEYFFRF
jgi:AP-1 complex subunit mu